MAEDFRYVRQNWQRLSEEIVENFESDSLENLQQLIQQICNQLEIPNHFENVITCFQSSTFQGDENDVLNSEMISWEQFYTRLDNYLVSQIYERENPPQSLEEFIQEINNNQDFNESQKLEENYQEQEDQGNFFEGDQEVKAQEENQNFDENQQEKEKMETSNNQIEDQQQEYQDQDLQQKMPQENGFNKQQMTAIATKIKLEMNSQPIVSKERAIQIVQNMTSKIEDVDIAEGFSQIIEDQEEIDAETLQGYLVDLLNQYSISIDQLNLRSNQEQLIQRLQKTIDEYESLLQTAPQNAKEQIVQLIATLQSKIQSIQNRQNPNENQNPFNSERQISSKQRYQQDLEYKDSIDFQKTPQGAQKKSQKEIQKHKLKQEKGLQEIYKFYSKQSLLVGKKATFDQITQGQNILYIGEFLAFLRDFQILKSQTQRFIKDRLLKMEECDLIYKKFAHLQKSMVFDQFKEALYEIADKFYNETYDQINPPKTERESVLHLTQQQKYDMLLDFIGAHSKKIYLPKMQGLGQPFATDMNYSRIPEYDLGLQYKFKDQSKKKKQIENWKKEKEEKAKQDQILKAQEEQKRMKKIFGHLQKSYQTQTNVPKESDKVINFQQIATKNEKTIKNDNLQDLIVDSDSDEDQNQYVMKSFEIQTHDSIQAAQTVPNQIPLKNQISAKQQDNMLKQTKQLKNAELQNPQTILKAPQNQINQQKVLKKPQHKIQKSLELQSTEDIQIQQSKTKSKSKSKNRNLQLNQDTKQYQSQPNLEPNTTVNKKAQQNLKQQQKQNQAAQMLGKSQSNPIMNKQQVANANLPQNVNIKNKSKKQTMEQQKTVDQSFSPRTKNQQNIQNSKEKIRKNDQQRIEQIQQAQNAKMQNNMQSILMAKNVKKNFGGIKAAN